MRLCRFDGDRLGLVEDDTLIDVTGALDVLPTVRYPLPAFDPLIANLAAVREAASALATTGSRIPLASVRLEAPVANPGKMMAAPLNYKKHVDEALADKEISGGAATTPAIHQLGLFLKANSSLIGPSDPVVARHPDRRNDHEVELVAIIGKRADRVPVEEALDYVVAYTIGLDMTTRGGEERSFRKSIDTYSVVGPWLVTADEIGDAGNLDIELSVDGEPRQNANTRDLILSIPELVAFASNFYTLMPGDMLFTGTPEGVGPVVGGNVMHVRIAGIGAMDVRVVDGF